VPISLPRLRELREQRFLSQRELAEKARVSPATIANLEMGHTAPRPSTARKLARALGVPPAALLGLLTNG
jgi:transcriptional regulator with XRE-family HTH domain